MINSKNKVMIYHF